MGNGDTTRRGVLAAGAGLVAAGAMVTPARGDEAMAHGAQMKLSADDRLELIELMALYAWSYDTSDAAGLAATFTPDGELEVFGNVLATVAGGFDGFLAQAQEMRGEHGWQHLADHHVFRDFDGNACTIHSYYTMAEANPQGADVTMRAMGYYTSHCVRTAGGWRFARRQVVRWNGQKPF